MMSRDEQEFVTNRVRGLYDLVETVSSPPLAPIESIFRATG